MIQFDCTRLHSRDSWRTGGQYATIWGKETMRSITVFLKYLVIAAYASPLILGSGIVVAQEDDSSAIEEIVVTAQKREQAIQTIPISIKALTGEMLENIGADSLDEVVRQVPSLSMTDLSRGGNNVQIRGLGSNVGNVGTVAIYRDGVIATNRIQSSGSFAEQDSALYDVERVEVLRGPQGTLYGEGSFGGVINIISKRPDATEFAGAFAATYFDTDGSDSTDLSGMINIPLVKDKLAARLVGYSYDHGGYIDLVNVLPVFFGAPPTLVDEKANTEEVTGGRMLLGWTPNDTFDATLIYKTEKTEIGISNYDSPDLIGLANTLGGTTFEPRFTQAGFSDAYGAENDSNEIVLEMNVETSIGSLTSITGWGEIEQTNAAGLISGSDATSQELRLSSDSDGRLNWTVGAYLRSAERDVNLNQGGGTIQPFNLHKLDQWSIFGQMYWQFSPVLTATLGLRYSEHDSEVTDLLLGLPTASSSFDNVSPKLALDWMFDDDTLLYASVAKGFRAGGTNVDQSLGTDPNFVLGFDPDSIWNYELGIKTGLFDGKVTLNAAVFHIDWQDIQIDKAINSVVVPPFQFIVVNGEDAHSTGIEADIYINPADGWEIVLGGSLIEAEFDNGTIDSATAGFGVPLAGERLASSPEYLFNASVAKDFSLGGKYDGYARADYSVRGNSFGDVPNTAPPGGSFDSGRMSSLNLRTGIGGDTWEVQAFVTNVTDEYVSTFNYYDGGFADLHVVLRPRTYGLTVRLRTN